MTAPRFGSMHSRPARMTACLLVFAVACLAAPALSAGPTSPSFTEPQLRDLRAAAAKPFPSDGPWHHEVYALANLCLNQNVEEANERILRNRAEHFPDEVLAVQEDGSFHWHAYLLERTYFLFNRRSPFFPGRLTPEAEKAIEEMLWTWVAPRYRPELVDPRHDWRISGSENHHLQRWGSFWGAYQILAALPEYASRPLAGGHTVRQAADAFSEYFRRFFHERLSKNCLFVECHAGYEAYSLGPLYNVADFAGDRELKRAAHLFLDTFWTCWASEQIDGMQGGSAHRLYPGRDTFVDMGGASSLARFHFDALPTRVAGLHPNQLCTATTFYRPRPEIIELARDPGTRGCYAIMARLAGLQEIRPGAADSHQYVEDLPQDAPLHFHGGCHDLLPDAGGITRYTWCTQDFVMGSSMVESRPHSEWAGISSQNRWNIVVFGGTPTGRIVAQPPRPKKGSVYNVSWSVQNKGARIEQRLKGAKSTRGMRIWFDKTLVITEKDGWIFAESPRAYAAVKIVDGGWTWAKPDLVDTRGIEGYDEQGRWAVFERESSPHVMEVVSKKDFTSLAAFQDAILANPIRRDDASIEYESGFYKTRLTLHTDYSRPPEIDGAPVNFRRPMTYESPFLAIPYGGREISFTWLDGRTETTDIP